MCACAVTRASVCVCVSLPVWVCVGVRSVCRLHQSPLQSSRAGRLPATVFQSRGSRACDASPRACHSLFFFFVCVCVSVCVSVCLSRHCVHVCVSVCRGRERRRAGWPPRKQQPHNDVGNNPKPHFRLSSPAAPKLKPPSIGRGPEAKQHLPEPADGLRHHLQHDACRHITGLYGFSA